MKRYFILFLFLASTFFASAAAEAVTTAQIEQFKKLSPSQQRAIAAQLETSEIKRNGIDSGIEKEPSSLPGIKPRVVSEISGTEKELRNRKKGQSPSLQLHRTSADSGTLQKVSGQKEADRKELLSSQSTFSRDSKPLNVSRDIKQFGYELFAGTPSTFAPINDVPVPVDYVIGSGDEFKIDLFGNKQNHFTLQVTRKGTLLFPEIGPIGVAGLTFSDAVSLIKRTVKGKMIGVNIYVTMGELRSIRVFVMGDVELPGSYFVSGLSTLSHALYVSGGIKKIGSLRNIQLFRSGKKVSSIDLYDFLLKGDTSSDVRLFPGDVIFAPPIGPTVGIAGEVKRPAIYELKDKTTVDELIKIAGGLRATGYLNLAQIERINKKGERVVIDLDLQNSGRKEVLQDGDFFKIFSVLDYEENVVYLSGNVKRPGKRAFFDGMRVSALVGENNDLLPTTYYDYALIERESEWNREPEVIRFNLGQAINRNKESDLLLKPQDKVYIFNRASFRQMPTVEIAGLVQSPGSYELKKGMRLIDLILASGSLLRDAYMDSAELYRTDPVSKKVTTYRLNLGKVLNENKEENLILHDMDRLVVHSVWEHKFQDFVTISGEVHNPGYYPRAEHSTIYDLLFAGGSLTKKAYRGKAEITRYKIINGKKRKSEHIEVSLEEILNGNKDANITLQPYDHLHIRTVSNWREAEKVSITGEVNFPGTYPVEEGETLSDLIDRAGGFTKDAFLVGGRFTREKIAKLKKMQFEEMADNLEADVARLSSSPAVAGGEKNVEKQKIAIAGLRQLADKLRKTEHNGRLVIKLMSSDKLRNSGYNVILRDGDALYVPKRPDSVLVMGEVYNSTAFLYEEGRNSNDYIKRAGGLTEIANEDDIYVVKADGSVIPAKKSFFASGVAIGAGDIVVVPEKRRIMSGMELTKDITQILYQLGLSAAAFKSVGVL